MAKGIGLREWSISRSDYEDDQTFRDAVASELAGFEHIGERLGVGLVSLPARERGPAGEWFTRGWVFRPVTVPAVSAATNGEVDQPGELADLVAAVPVAEPEAE